jgi:TonB family protein
LLPAAPPTSYATAYYAGSGANAPALIPLNVTDLASGPCKKIDGTTEVSMVVTKGGMPARIYLLRATGNDLDKLALRIAEDDRFNPGSYNGAQAATAVSNQITLRACIRETPNDEGQNVAAIILRSTPEQKIALLPQSSSTTGHFIIDPSQDPSIQNHPPYKIGGDVSAPVLIHKVSAQFTEQARQAHFQGICLVSLIVDAQGMPVKIRIARALGMGLDMEAIEAIKQYRFTPAMKDGAPVPVMVTIEVDFRLT